MVGIGRLLVVIDEIETLADDSAIAKALYPGRLNLDR